MCVSTILPPMLIKVRLGLRNNQVTQAAFDKYASICAILYAASFLQI